MLYICGLNEIRASKIQRFIYPWFWKLESPGASYEHHFVSHEGLLCWIIMWQNCHLMGQSNLARENWVLKQIPWWPINPQSWPFWYNIPQGLASHYCSIGDQISNTYEQYIQTILNTQSVLHEISFIKAHHCRAKCSTDVVFIRVNSQDCPFLNFLLKMLKGRLIKTHT